ncbi:MAG: sulfatase-like hydrolase/transferase [Planctomycetales bacterium]|nr:sulfatase-like hydrolase/transferase [Planctomycetales bacterium]MBN8628493.1 sulfatase-like hydrolase/transferase [Planctomycetota bacterium]
MRHLVLFAILTRALIGGDLQAAEARPNVVLIVADDMRPDAVAALGNASIRTPNLDQLVRRGTTFLNATCAYPICVVSRAELLTGCTGFRALQPPLSGKLNESLPTLPATLRAAGYHTYHVGKWHVTGTPHERGYEATAGWYGSGGGKWPLTYPTDHRGRPVTGYSGWVIKNDAGKPQPELGVGLTPNISERFADAAIQLLERDQRGKPFFLHVNFTAPHDPRFFPRGLEDAYDRRELSPPKNFAAAHPFDHGNLSGRDEVLLPRPLTPEIIQEELAVYYAIVQHLDEQIGRIVSALESKELNENTIVIFTSDHGMAVGSHGLAGKQNMYDHTIRVPLIVAGPGVPPDRRSAALCYLRDLFPTICERCGIEPPSEIDGRSLAKLWSNRDAEGPYRELYGYFTNTQRMIRTDRWKLVRYPQVGRRQFFDLRADPDELNNLAEDKSHAATVKLLDAKLCAWLREQGDPLGLKPVEAPQP